MPELPETGAAPTGGDGQSVHLVRRRIGVAQKRDVTDGRSGSHVDPAGGPTHPERKHLGAVEDAWRGPLRHTVPVHRLTYHGHLEGEQQGWR